MVNQNNLNSNPNNPQGQWKWNFGYRNENQWKSRNQHIVQKPQEIIQQVRQDNVIKVKRTKNNRKHDDDDDDDDDRHSESIHQNVNVTFSHLLHLSFRLMIGGTITLYILNQKHLLPKPLSAVVSKSLFWPTLPITVSRRIGRWVTEVDDTVVMGGAPFGFCRIPQQLYDNYDVRGVINMCEEYDGPIKTYKTLGMQELHLKTVDHFEPSLTDLKRAVSFIRRNEMQQQKVYVHCRAGHGRSAAVVLAWLLYKNPNSDPFTLNNKLCEIRDVRKTLWKQHNIKEFYSLLQNNKFN